MSRLVLSSGSRRALQCPTLAGATSQTNAVGRTCHRLATSPGATSEYPSLVALDWNLSVPVCRSPSMASLLHSEPRNIACWAGARRVIRPRRYIPRPSLLHNLAAVSSPGGLRLHLVGRRARRRIPGGHHALSLPDQPPLTTGPRMHARIATVTKLALVSRFEVRGSTSTSAWLSRSHTRARLRGPSPGPSPTARGPRVRVRALEAAVQRVPLHDDYSGSCSVGRRILTGVGIPFTTSTSTWARKDSHSNSGGARPGNAVVPRRRSHLAQGSTRRVGGIRARRRGSQHYVVQNTPD
ncbi:hypothetical protein C8Q80DRAFT_512685 [Daedaleopsis nitida]|nr:hypothetical protein C8Q80DRAFT_512685 [Daedaleopsis nitida]